MEVEERMGEVEWKGEAKGYNLNELYTMTNHHTASKLSRGCHRQWPGLGGSSASKCRHRELKPMAGKLMTARQERRWTNAPADMAFSRT